MDTLMSKKKKTSVIYCIISGEEEFLGYFKDLLSAQNFLDREEKEEAVILEVVSVMEAVFPPEPELEFVVRDLSSLL
jgi:hypothetical protein